MAFTIPLAGTLSRMRHPRIAFLDRSGGGWSPSTHQPFWVSVNIEGSTRQKHRRPRATQEKRWFDPPDPKDVGRHTLQESMVDNLVSKQNLLIRDVSQSRRMEGKTVNLIDVAEFSGGAGIGMNGDEVLTDLLSLGETCLPSDSPTTVMDFSSCN